MDTTNRDLREIDQRIADLNLSLTEQLATLNLSLNGRLSDIQSDLDHHRWQTHYYHRNTLSRLGRLEARRKDRQPLFQNLDSVIIIRMLFWVGMAAAGVISWAEVGKLVIN
jgi:hypothetical protein